PLVSSGGYAGVSVGYRLSGESKWPTQIHDCKAAIRWIRAHAAEHGIDPDRIAVWGTSAGGHLVSMLGTTADVEAMNGDIGTHDAHSERVTCVVDFFGPTDLLKMNAMAIEGATLDHDAPTSPESLLIGEPIQSAVDKTKTANPIGYVTPDDAAFLIVHGTMDPLVSYQQSVIFHETLRDVGVRSTLITVEGGGHGKGFGRDVDAAVVRFLDHHLRGREVEWSDERVRAESVRRRKSIR
ncbi:MAG: alpha/beta hydrolase, partial [Planctomycetota bacterium]